MEEQPSFKEPLNMIHTRAWAWSQWSQILWPESR